MVLLKLLQSLFKALHNEGTPGQVAAGIAHETLIQRIVELAMLRYGRSQAVVKPHACAQELSGRVPAHPAAP